MVSGTRRSWSAVGLCSAVALLGTLAQLFLPAAAAGTAPGADGHYVKYYLVASSYEGRAETLGGIATRLLGDAGRAEEIFGLNLGRRQPDGGTLTDPDKLRAGWALVLPWDAVHPDVKYGLLPAAAPPPTGRPQTQPSTVGTVTPSALPSPAPSPTPSTAPSAPPACTPPAPRRGSGWDWAALRLAPSQAWARGRGNGQVVAVIDSGADSGVPQLAGRVAQGADVLTGGSRGDIDCLGTGTAMAGIIAAQPLGGSTLTGLAPEATVVPIRVTSGGAGPRKADEARAIEVAVSAGATVLALGSAADLTDAGVARAVATAESHDVVVIVGAQPASGGRREAGPPPSLLRVGAVAGDGKAVVAYQPGAVDVVAPGADIATVGAGGTGPHDRTGTQYAVAFVAAQAALVRSAHPSLSAAQVVARIKNTADRMGSGSPDAAYGWGMINPGTSVTTELSEQEGAASPRADGSGGSSAWPVTLTILGLVAVIGGAGLLAWVRRRMRAAGGMSDPMAPGDPALALSAEARPSPVRVP